MERRMSVNRELALVNREKDVVNREKDVVNREKAPVNTFIRDKAEVSGVVAAIKRE
jgi:hypothetical protein